MEVTRQAFQYQLPRILTAIADSTFVAFDIEFSGLPNKKGSGGRTGDASFEKQTLQQRYQETKEAAEKYQILQLGLTCVAEDRSKGEYVLKPYNFNVNPVLEEKRLDIDRVWSYSSSAIKFLMENSFRMDAPFLEGVPYLSRDEEHNVRRQESGRRDQMRKLANIVVHESDVETFEFLSHVREAIDSWLALERNSEEYLNYPAPSTPESPSPSISNYQKRLIHQLVRAQYPDLVTFGRAGFIQIQHQSSEREEAVKRLDLEKMNERILRQTGLRWVVEAMCGGDLERLDPKPFSFDSKAQKHFKEVLNRLRLKRTILVGHNLFTDLVYFYSCFFGTLPDRVEDFQKTIHDLFPMVIDTKYLATHNSGSTNFQSSLADLDAILSQVQHPTIVTHKEHPNYLTNGSLHEAGFDSFLTARVLLRLLTKLQQEASFLREFDLSSLSDEEYFTPPEDSETQDNSKLKGGVARLNPVKQSPRAKLSNKSKESSVDTVPEEASLISFDDPPDGKSTLSAPRASGTPRYARKGQFDPLIGLQEDEPSKKGLASSPKRSLLDEYSVEGEGTPGDSMPPVGSVFWKAYGNKLRVFGTVEELCDLEAS